MTDLVFMFSNWYSGATLLAILLNNHPKIICNGETFPFRYDENNKDIYICSCGEHLLDCDFYSAVSQSMKNRDGRWNNHFRILPKLSSRKVLNKLFLSFNNFFYFRDFLLDCVPPYCTEIRQYFSAHRQFYERACRFSNSSIYIDGTKSVRRADLIIKNKAELSSLSAQTKLMPLRYNSFPAKIIYLIRDARGFCWSFLKNNKLDKKELGRATQAWLDYIHLVDSFTDRHPAIPLHVVRYEDLCADSTQTMQDLCYFLGVDFDSAMIGVPGEYHMLGNRMRSSFDGTVKEDLAWQEQFGPVEIATIERSLKKYMVRYNYL